MNRNNGTLSSSEDKTSGFRNRECLDKMNKEREIQYYVADYEVWIKTKYLLLLMQAVIPAAV